MLKWKRIAESFVSIDVANEYNGEPYYWTTFYYYKGLVIDTGCPHTAQESVELVKKMKLDVKAVLLTHFHEDHSGAAYLFKETFDVDVFAPKKSLEILQDPPEIPGYRQVVWGQPKPVKAKPVEKEMTINQTAIRTVDTPGHSFDHVSFMIEDILFMGDLVANPRPVIVMQEEDYTDLISSLRKVVNLDFKKAYGGHGAWDKKALKATLDYIVGLKRQVEELSKSGLSPEKIVEKIFSNVPKKVFQIEAMSGHEWSRRNLVESLLGRRRKAVQP